MPETPRYFLSASGRTSRRQRHRRRGWCRPSVARRPPLLVPAADRRNARRALLSYLDCRVPRPFFPLCGIGCIGRDWSRSTLLTFFLTICILFFWSIFCLFV